MTAKRFNTGPTRRGLLKAGAAGLALTSAIGIAPRFIARPAHAADLAAGMTGGPTGFPGAERYQYNGDMSEGRAIEGIKKLKAAGKAPEKLVMMILDGAIGQLVKPFPEGAPTVQQVWERDSGVKLEFITVATGEEFTKILRDVTAKEAAYDIYTMPWNSLGDLVEAGALVAADEYAAKYKPDFDDPERGYVGGARGVQQLTFYDGKRYAVSLDGDFQTWIYRRDLFENEDERKNFKAKYGYDLDYPKTYEQLDQMAEFFHRPDKGLLGVTDLRNQGWGYTNWYQRYATMAAPNQYLFDKAGTPLIDGEAGVKAAQEYVNSLKWHSKDAISWSWPEQYGNMGEGGAAMTCAFSNMPKFLDNPGTKVGGKLISALPPGRKHGDQLIRRSVLWYSAIAGVSSQSKWPEATWLFIQWLGSTRTYSWMTGNPAGYYDPFQLANFKDPLVEQSYKGYHLPTMQGDVARGVPSLNVAGAQAFHNALDENLVAATTGQKTPEQAMKATAAEWKKLIKKKGGDKLVSAINAYQATWPDTIDKA